MTRSFASRRVPDDVLNNLIDLASRAPSAGKAQGWHVVALLDADVASFWDVTLPPDRRASFRWQQLLDAPVILLPFADRQAYIDRYSEPDKQSTGLGTGPDAWPTPYWTVDASMSMMTLLLAAEDAGLGALLFAVFNGEDDLRSTLRIPDRLDMLGAIALGYPDTSSDDDGHGRSAGRPRRTVDEIMHRGRW